MADRRKELLERLERLQNGLMTAETQLYGVESAKIEDVQDQSENYGKEKQLLVEPPSDDWHLREEDIEDEDNNVESESEEQGGDFPVIDADDPEQAFEEALSALRKRREKALEAEDTSPNVSKSKEHELEEKKREDIGETEKEVEDQSSQVWNSPLIFEEEKSDSPKAKPEPKPTNKMPSSGSENSFSFRSPSQRLENLERFYREKEVEECTFHPRINELPRSMATTFSSVPFYERAKKWAKSKEMVLKKRLKEQEETEVQGCTFQPKTNPHVSSEVVETNDRQKRLNTLSRKSDKVKRKKEEIEKEKEEEFARACTFQPNMTSTRRSKQLRDQSRLKGTNNLSPTRLSSRGWGSVDVRSGEVECTFTPRINERSRRVARSSKTLSGYLNEKAYARLSRVRNVVNAENTRVAAKNARPQSAPPRRASSGGTDFSSFLERQQECETRKREKLRLLLDSTGEVRVNKPSKTTTRHASGGFIERQERAWQNKQKTSLEGMRKEQVTIDKECTFTPVINKKSRQMPRRTVEDMSRGDILRKSARLDAMKLQREQRELEGVTFQPRIGPKSHEVAGRLRVTSEPDTYLDRLKEEVRLREERAQMLQYQKEKRELSECTFAPEIHDAPSYVKRIARSMALARSSYSGDDYDNSTSSRRWM